LLAPLAALGARDRDAGDRAVPRHGAREHRLRPPRRVPGGDRASGPCGARTRVHHAAPGRVRYDPGRARDAAQRRAAPADRDRAGDAARPGDPDLRRGDERARHRVRATRPARDRAALRGEDGVPDRASAVDGPACGPDPGHGPGAHRRARDASGAARSRRAVPPVVRHAIRGGRPPRRLGEPIAVSGAGPKRVGRAVRGGAMAALRAAMGKRAALDPAALADPAGAGAVDSILFLRLDRLGDLLVSTPTIVAMRARFPDARITLLVSPRTVRIASWVPGVDEV